MKACTLVILAAVAPALAAATAPSAEKVRTGAAAYGDYQSDAPGVWRRIAPADLPAPYASAAATRFPRQVPRPADAQIRTLPGFAVTAFATGLKGPRRLRTAPNGDLFVAESTGGRISVLRARPGAEKAEQSFVFAEGLKEPYGIAFYPATSPQWVYVGMTGKVVRFPYRDGDTRARGPAETVISNIPVGGGHWTRDIAFSVDGTKLFLAVGSGSNDAEAMSKRTTDEIAQVEAEAGVKGVSWAEEKHRAVVMVSDPDGRNQKVYAAGIRNCSGLTVNPRGGDLWCTVNERDLLGDDLVPDYSTRVKPGQFYGWPWLYIGAHEDPRHAGERPDLAKAVSTPEVLYQSHSAPLQMTFYDAAGPAAFPRAYDGDAFVAMHGSWNRSDRTGYKVVRLRMKNGVPTGEYEDFVMGFVTDAGTVWGRPVGVAEAKDGSLLVSDDAGAVIWRVGYRAKTAGAK